LVSLEEHLEQIESDMQVFPNPFDNEITIKFDQAIKQSDQIYIYDSRGNRVAIIDHSPGINEVHWNGTNHNGNTMKPGIYYISANIGGKMTQQKIIKIK
jgi:flagellar hook assembly protein FlgD